MPANGPAQIVDEHVVITHLPLGIEQDAVEHVDDRPDLDFEAGLFEHFARKPRLERFAELQPAAGQAPLAGQRLEPPFHEHHLPSWMMTAPTPTIGWPGYWRDGRVALTGTTSSSG